MPVYPYAQPIGALSLIITKLRSSFPTKLDAATLKKLSIASNNESYIINTLRFIGAIDKEGNRTDLAHGVFLLSEGEFQPGLGELTKAAYRNLFELYGEDAWTLDKQKLISYIRAEDKSTELVGTRQSETFIRLAELSGMREPGNGHAAASPVRSPLRTPRTPLTATKARRLVNPQGTPDAVASTRSDSRHIEHGGGISLAVKIELNLPASPDQAVFDAIFKSLRENIIDRD